MMENSFENIFDMIEDIPIEKLEANTDPIIYVKGRLENSKILSKSLIMVLHLLRIKNPGSQTFTVKDLSKLISRSANQTRIYTEELVSFNLIGKVPKGIEFKKKELSYFLRRDNDFMLKIAIDTAKKKVME